MTKDDLAYVLLALAVTLVLTSMALNRSQGGRWLDDPRQYKPTARYLNLAGIALAVASIVVRNFF
jgi:hypothetical protein